MRPLIAIAAFVLASVGAMADVNADLARVKFTLDRCIKTDDTNVGMKQCVAAAFRDADKLLNRTYQGMSKEWIGDDIGSSERKKRLIAAQRAWIAFRDVECSLQATEMLGGTGEGLIVGQCLYEMTANRVVQIEDLMKPK